MRKNDTNTNTKQTHIHDDKHTHTHRSVGRPIANDNEKNELRRLQYATRYTRNKPAKLGRPRSIESSRKRERRDELTNEKKVTQYFLVNVLSPEIRESITAGMRMPYVRNKIAGIPLLARQQEESIEEMARMHEKTKSALTTKSLQREQKKELTQILRPPEQ